MKETYALAIRFESAPHRAMVLDVLNVEDPYELSNLIMYIDQLHEATAHMPFRLVFCKEDWHGPEGDEMRVLVADIERVPAWVSALAKDGAWQASMASFSEKEISLLATHLAITHNGHAFVSWKL